MAKVCVVLATYNGEKYLTQMLDSLIAQTRPANLIVAVDDGSKDGSVQILYSYRDRLPLQIHLNPTNMGHRYTFSRALDIAKEQLSDEDYVALADQDDIWLPQKLETLEKEFEKQQGSALIFGDAQVIDGQGKVICSSWRKEQGLFAELEFCARIAGINNVTGCLSLFRASLLKKVLPIPEGVGVHDAWIALYAEKNGGVLSIAAPVIQYRLHENNAVGKGTHFSFDVTCNKQIEWMALLMEHKNSLAMTKDEADFTYTLCSYWNERLHKFILFEFAFWLFQKRHLLFPAKKARYKKIIFSLLGAPAVHLFFGKSK